MLFTEPLVLQIVAQGVAFCSIMDPQTTDFGAGCLCRQTGVRAEVDGWDDNVDVDAMNKCDFVALGCLVRLHSIGETVNLYVEHYDFDNAQCFVSEYEFLWICLKF